MPPAPKNAHSSGPLRRFFRENGLSVLLIGLFFSFLGAETVVGYFADNNERQQRGEAPISYPRFLASGRCLEATTENWESEFLEMAAFVWLTSLVYQKGSPASKNPYGQDSEKKLTGQSPWPARRGGWMLAIYKRSLSLAFLLLFLISMLLHAIGGQIDHNRTQRLHGEPTVSLLGFLGTSEFWFQSFQNWQSEFLGIASMVLLSIWLRQTGSAESKHVNTPHGENEN